MFFSKTKLFFILFFISCILVGCSWVERFVIFNTLDESILVNYTLTQPDENGFAIFDQYVECYPLKNKENLDWNQGIKIVDLDSNGLAFSFEIPAKSAFIFGQLYNDTYKKYDQYYINGRSFNLEKLEIINSNETATISPETFDQFFTKKNGIIAYTVK